MSAPSRASAVSDAEEQLTELLRQLPFEVLAEVGLDVAFVGQAEDDQTPALRNLAGLRTPLLQHLLVRAGHDLGSACVAVPIVCGDSLLGIVYGGMRAPHRLADIALSDLARPPGRAGAQLRVSGQVMTQVEAAVQEERNRMAVELHDKLGAMLFSIGAQVRDLRGDPETSPLLAARLERIQDQLRDAGSALRESLTALRSTVPAAALPASLQSDCRAFEIRSGTRARAVVLGELPALDEHRTAAVTAAVREALVNVEKHADARTVMVTAVASDGGILVAVSDDGRGRGSEGDGHGMGLAAARDRLEQVGGRLTSFVDEDGGWTVRAWVPHL